VIGEVHINAIESFLAMLKLAIYGIFIMFHRNNCRFMPMSFASLEHHGMILHLKESFQ
jgi:hypothetical protein